MFFLDVLKDQNGNPSSKRMSGFVALLLLIMFAIKQCWFPLIVDSKIIFNSEVFFAIVGIVCFSIGMSAAEFKKQ